MSRDRQLAAAAERRRAERAINTISPATTRTPSRTQSQTRSVLEAALDVAETVDCADAVTLCAGG